MAMKLLAYLPIYLAAAVLAGCGGQSEEHAVAAPPPTLENPEAIAACLPTGVTLDTKVSDKEGDSSESVKDALARYGARTKSHHLYDLNGREIRFYQSSAKGLAINKDKEYNKLRKRYTVIVHGGD